MICTRSEGGQTKGCHKLLVRLCASMEEPALCCGSFGLRAQALYSVAISIRLKLSKYARCTGHGTVRRELPFHRSGIGSKRSGIHHPHHTQTNIDQSDSQRVVILEHTMIYTEFTLFHSTHHSRCLAKM